MPAEAFTPCLDFTHCTSSYYSLYSSQAIGDRQERGVGYLAAMRAVAYSPVEWMRCTVAPFFDRSLTLHCRTSNCRLWSRSSACPSRMVCRGEPSAEKTRSWDLAESAAHPAIAPSASRDSAGLGLSSRLAVFLFVLCHRLAPGDTRALRTQTERSSPKSNGIATL